MLPSTLILAFGLVSLGAAAAIPSLSIEYYSCVFEPELTIICTDIIDRSASFPNVKREVDNSVYILTKGEDEDGLYKKDGLYRKVANGNGLYERDGLYQKAENEDGLYKRDGLYKKADNADGLYKS